MVINRNITSTNKEIGYNKKNLYIVIHYTANNGDTAYGNTCYFKSAYRGASANYFVDKTSIWQCVDDYDIAWHCGSESGYYYNGCRNYNSIGIEMCSVIVNGVYQIPEETVSNTVWLVKDLMEYYNIPASNVIRHYDVTHKRCPEPFVRDESQWTSFKNRISEKAAPKHWCEDIKNTLLSKKVITDDAEWSDYDGQVTKALFMAIIDNATGGRWNSDEADSSIHWAQPSLISLCGKGKIKDKSQWQDYETPITKALALALVDASTDNLQGTKTDGMVPKYIGVKNDHWCRNCLDSLCDKNIINNPKEWSGHWDDILTKGECMALIYKAYYK